jgi:hypothetical protein
VPHQRGQARYRADNHEDGLRDGSHAACFVGPRLHEWLLCCAALADSAGLWPR